ncbi:hypothetical protein LTR49_017490 [Elasticomyces elasticus]|nr:hypothetical protein LTR49_017490 [Elasticomyces elasticus]
MAISSHTSTVTLQQDIMATNIGPNYTPLSQNWDDYEQQPVDWSWLADFTVNTPAFTQTSLPSDGGMDFGVLPNHDGLLATIATMGVGSRIEVDQAPHDPRSTQPHIEASGDKLHTTVSTSLHGHSRNDLQDYIPKATRRKTSGVPGYSCFSIVPEGTKARRQTLRAAQENINKLRKRGACMLCRIRNVKCSLEDPCMECRRLVDRAKSGTGSIVSLSPCLRSFTEVDPFQYLRNTEFSYLTTTKPYWGRWATGRPDEYDSFKCIKLLAIAYTVNHKASQVASSRLPEVNPATWSHFASDVLGLVDGFIKRKKFWEDRNSALILIATMDLLMGICLDMALHIHERRGIALFSRDARVYSALIERCTFCVRKVMSFRKIMLQRLDMTEPSYFEEAAFATLSKVSPRSAAIEDALGTLHDMRTHLYRIDRCLSSKELLMLQSVHLCDMELLEESLSQGADLHCAREAQHKRRNVIGIAADSSDAGIQGRLRAAAREVERGHEVPQAVAGARQQALKSVRTTLMAYAREQEDLSMLQSASALSGSTSDSGNALSMAVSYELSNRGSKAFHMMTAVLNTGADVNARNANGLTALMVAIQSTSSIGTQCVKLLLDHGADANARAPDGRNLATITAQSRLDDSLERLHLLIAYGAESPAESPGSRPISLGDCKSRMLERMDMGFGGGPWTFAASTGAKDVVCLLLDYGANNNNNELWVIWCRVDEMEARLLLQRAADDYSKSIRAVSAEGRKELVPRRSGSKLTSHNNAIRAASAGAHQAVVRLLLNSGVNLYRDLLNKALHRGDGKAVYALLEGLRSLKARGPEAEVPLLLTMFRPTARGASLIKYGF